MNRKFYIAAFGLAIAAYSGLSCAQFGLPSLPGKSTSGSGAAAVTAESLVKSYVGGTQQVMNADAKLLEALGLKEQAAKEELAAKNLTEGATKGGLEDAAKVQTESSKALADAMTGNKVAFTADAKKNFTQGLGHLAGGIKSYIGMSSDVKSFKPGLGSFGGAGAAAVYIAKSLPDSITGLKDTLTRAIAFAKENKIQVPDDATSVL